jgi:hypothetical protein
MIGEHWLGRDVEGSGSGLISDTMPDFARGTEQNYETSIKMGMWWELNTVCADREAGTLLNPFPCSVWAQLRSPGERRGLASQPSVALRLYYKLKIEKKTKEMHRRIQNSEFTSTLCKHAFSEVHRRSRAMYCFYLQNERYDKQAASH